MLEKFFLEPGSHGPIGSVSVDDDALIEILDAADLREMRDRFVSSITGISRLKSLLAGEYPPLSFMKPDYMRILTFVCWMQTSKVREEQDTDFREMLGRHTGINFLGALMRGLNPMWDHLQAYLANEHGIELALPGLHPHAQIGRTLRIAFPTLRDKAAFKRLRQIIGQQKLLDPMEVSRGVATHRDMITDTMPSFAYNFRLFDISWRRGGSEYLETTFWKAWYNFVAEYTALEDLLVVRGDFGDHELFRVSPSGERRALRDPEDARRFVPDAIAKAIKSGAVLMEDLGWGRARATSTQASNLILLRRSRLNECDDGAIRSYDDINSRWVLANFRNRENLDIPSQGARRAISWRDGIKIGGAYLGRSPFTPILSLPSGLVAKVSLAGDEIEMAEVPGGLAFPSGIYAGTATAQADDKVHNTLLVPRAVETPRNRRLMFDRFRDVGEDQFYRGTVPSTDCVLRPWSGERMKTCEEMTNIAEALYARTARGLAFVDALEIVRRGLSPAPSAPREWDILRTFADAGWFDLTLVRNFPARRLLQRPPALRMFDPETLTIEGPTPLAFIERLETVASAAGGTVEMHDGKLRILASSASLPMDDENAAASIAYLRNMFGSAGTAGATAETIDTIWKDSVVKGVPYVVKEPKAQPSADRLVAIADALSGLDYRRDGEAIFQAFVSAAKSIPGVETLSGDNMPVTKLVRSIIDDAEKWPRKVVTANDHPGRCETSCYKCLQRYNNRNFHGLLDWRLGLAYLRAIVDPDYDCGFNGNFEAFEIRDWKETAKRLADQTSTFIPGNKVSAIKGIPAFTLGNGGSHIGVVVHPLWNQDRLFAALGLDHRYVAIDSFELARRPLLVLQRARDRW
ncbi:hypothetical protein [Rhizobium phaseoli]|uniref:hypothetical protein n=1 Tax=Rhizobium phaseoli TaxID=396 RepID=UPI0016809BBD|nr:hypothetical protein [Rhizobium phaseoli]